MASSGQLNWGLHSHALKLYAECGTVTRTSATDFNVKISARFAVIVERSPGSKIFSGTMYAKPIDGVNGNGMSLLQSHRPSNTGGATGTHKFSGLASKDATTREIEIDFRYWDTSPHFVNGFFIDPDETYTLTLSVKVPAWTGSSGGGSGSGGGASDKTYTIKAGDTLWGIAAKNLGYDPNDKSKGPAIQKEVDRLASLNGIKDPDKIRAGDVIKLGTSGGGSSASSSSSITNLKMGPLSTNDNTLLATWDWSKADTESYKAHWDYDLGNGTWLVGSHSSISIDEDDPDMAQQSTYSVPSGAVKVRFKVKPISKKNNNSNGNESYKWTVNWSKTVEWTNQTPLATPSEPSVKIDGYKLTATLDNVDIAGATSIVFQIVKDNSEASLHTSKPVSIVTGHVSYSYDINPGSKYKVRCYAYNNNDKNKSEWSNYSGEEYTIPAVPTGAPSVKAASETSVRLDWAEMPTAESYDIEYTTEKDHFDITEDTTTKTGIETTSYELLGLESGKTYFFRIRAVNDKGSSSWSEISSVVIGTDPAAPTTWSSTTTAITGESVTLYWVHNTEDGSSQTTAQLELTIGTTTFPFDIKNLTSEEEKDKTRSCQIDTEKGYIRWVEDATKTYVKMEVMDTPEVEYTALDDVITTTGEQVYMYVDDGGNTAYCTFVGSTCYRVKYDDGTKEYYLGVFKEGVKIQWRVRTAGITNVYGDWSTQRTIDVYAPATLDLKVTTLFEEEISILENFPFMIYGVPGPETQTPTGYHLEIISNDYYETVDNVGNPKIVNADDIVYSKFFDVNHRLLVELSAGDVTLENNASYTVRCTVSMSTGLTAVATKKFSVSWIETRYEPNAEISVDTDSYTATIRPYCERTELLYHKVEYANYKYTKTDHFYESMYGTLVKRAKTTTGEQVYSGVSPDGEDIYYCKVMHTTPVTEVYLSVYRREYDGTFTKIADYINGSENTSVIDPHPALDYARYRIVATDMWSGTVSYYDLPGYPVGGTSVIVQWDEEWSEFETMEDVVMEKPPWAGSLLKLPYNIDVSDSHSLDTELVKYIGRSHPVSYYGTQLGTTSSWSMVIPKSDRETLYALRRLARWLGDVYVREPSGTGYWANINVSFSQKHKDVTIPVSFNITRVEGGV